MSFDGAKALKGVLLKYAPSFLKGFPRGLHVQRTIRSKRSWARC